MGTVYLAEDRHNNNVQCVIKQLTNKYSDPQEHSEAIRLFRREAEILRTLDHHGVVRVFDDHATEDGRYFLVMDYVPGRNLEVMLNTGGTFSTPFVVQLAIQCCEVLQYIHEQDPAVIYRDLKPSNLMLTPDGRIVFIDFGIARSFMPTQAATRVVTAGYSPPEQYFGKPETRSDLYSLGATICHLTTGRRPKPLTVCTPGLANPQVSPSVDDLVRRLTAQNPLDRPESARQVKYELHKIYKEFFPDYEIPADAIVPTKVKEPVAVDAESGRAYVRARYGHMGQKPPEPEPPEPPVDRAGMRNSQKNAATEKPGLWHRVKQMIEIWFH
jgi:serine/threonine-protein kinase